MGGKIRSFGLLNVFRCKSLCRPSVGSVGKTLLPRFLLTKRNYYDIDHATRTSTNSQIFELSEHDERLLVNVVDVVAFQITARERNRFFVVIYVEYMARILGVVVTQVKKSSDTPRTLENLKSKPLKWHPTDFLLTVFEASSTPQRYRVEASRSGCKESRDREAAPDS